MKKWKQSKRYTVTKTYNTGRQETKRRPPAPARGDGIVYHPAVGNMNEPVVHIHAPNRRRGSASWGKKIALALSAAVFVVPLLFFGVYSISDVDATVSEQEKRNLKTMPAFSAQSLLDGKFTKEFEEYYSDTFPLRGFFLKVNNFVSSLFSQQSNSDGIVLVGKDDKDDFAGEALEDESDAPTQEETQAPPPTTEAPNAADVTTNGYIIMVKDRAMEMYAANKSQISSYAAAVLRLVDKVPNAKVYNLLAPTAIEFYSPEEYHTANHSQKKGIQMAYDAMGSKVIGVDAYSKLAQHTNEYIYFRTDHHWTARGAYYGYLAFAEAAGLTPKPLESYQTGRIDGFVGTMYGYTQSQVLKDNPDYVEYFLPQTKAEGKRYSSAAMSDGRELRIVTTDVSAGNKYLAFIQGDNPLVKITTANQNGKRIIVVKESYGNALVPFLVENYEEIYVVDPRRIDMDLPAFINQHQIQDVLMINYTLIPGNKTYMSALNKLIG